MKKITITASLLFFLVLGLNAAYAERRAAVVKVGKNGAGVSRLEGSAEVLPDGQKKWRALRIQEMLRAGDDVRTGSQSRIELTLPDGSQVRFADNTRFKITSLAAGDASDDRNVKVHLALGRSWANLSKATGTQKGGFEISSQNAVAGVRGTVYRMNVNEDKSALVRVYDGEVFVKGGGEAVTEAPKPMGALKKVAGPKKVEGPRKVSMAEWTVIIRSMQQIVVKSDGVAEAPREFTEEEDKDTWVDWNKENDKAISR